MVLEYFQIQHIFHLDLEVNSCICKNDKKTVEYFTLKNQIIKKLIYIPRQLIYLVTITENKLNKDLRKYTILKILFVVSFQLESSFSKYKYLPGLGHCKISNIWQTAMPNENKSYQHCHLTTYSGLDSFSICLFLKKSSFSRFISFLNNQKIRKDQVLSSTHPLKRNNHTKRARKTVTILIK